MIPWRLMCLVFVLTKWTLMGSLKLAILAWTSLKFWVMICDSYDCYIKSVRPINFLIPYKYKFTFDNINFYSKSLSD